MFWYNNSQPRNASREQIHRLHLFQRIPLFTQPLGIAGGGGGVAADIDHPRGDPSGQQQKGWLHRSLCGAGPARSRPGAAPSAGKAGGGCAGVGAEKAALGGDGVAHAGGIGLGAFNRFWHDLHAHQLPAVVYHRKADGAHAAVEVQQQVVRGAAGHIGPRCRRVARRPVC